MPDADANFGVSLDLDFSTWWRHVKTIYKTTYSNMKFSIPIELWLHLISAK